MGQPRIIAGEGMTTEQVRMAMILIASQVAAASIPLPAMKRQDRGPFNKAKEEARRRRQIEKRKGQTMGKPRVSVERIKRALDAVNGEVSGISFNGYFVVDVMRDLQDAREENRRLKDRLRKRQ